VTCKGPANRRREASEKVWVSTAWGGSMREESSARRWPLRLRSFPYCGEVHVAAQCHPVVLHGRVRMDWLATDGGVPIAS